MRNRVSVEKEEEWRRARGRRSPDELEINETIVVTNVNHWSTIFVLVDHSSAPATETESG